MDDALLDRLRTRFAGRSDIVEKRMVGGRSFSLGDRMFCGVNRHGLMVRVDTDGLGETLQLPGVSQMSFGDRVLLGYVVIESGAVARDDDLQIWVDRGLAFARSR